jgi:hypothetical protein
MYKIFLDKSKTFQCNVNIEGASLDKSKARLLIETSKFSLTFNGEIKNGVVKIPIEKLKGVINEDDTGKISLEIIAEDTLFVPWEGEYVAGLSKKVSVELDESLNESTIEEPDVKPKMSVSMILDEFDTSHHITEISKILESRNVNKTNLVKNKEVFNKLVEKYCSLNLITDRNNITSIKKDLIKKLK